MAGDSQASFSQSVKVQICGVFAYRSTPGQYQLRNAVELGILSKEYKRNAVTNGMVQCPTCHAYFTKNLLVLSLPIPVLRYLDNYITGTAKNHQKPLHEVFELLVDALEGRPVDLPDPKAILPYIGLFTLVTLNPPAVVGNALLTSHFPSLSIIRDKNFVPAPDNTSPTANNVARIFDSLADTPDNLGRIPISPGSSAFKEKRYWRLPVPAGGIFAALIAQLQFDCSNCIDIKLAYKIRDTLNFQRLNLDALDDNAGSSDHSGDGGSSGGGGPSGGSGPSGGGGGGGGGLTGRDRGRSKRRNTGGKSSVSAEKGKKKARKADRDGVRDGDESSDTSNFPPHYGQSIRQNIASWVSAIGGDAPENVVEIDRDNSDSEPALSISAIDPPNKDNPDEWRFGPSFSTNKIIFTARAVNLT